MHYPDANSRKGRPTTFTFAALTGATVVALTLPSVANADPVPSPAPPPPAPTGNVFMQGPPPPADAPAPAPAPPVDPNAPPPAGDPNAPAPPPPAPLEPGRVNNAAGGFSYVVPAGWKVSDATQLSYGQALLNKLPPEPAQPGAQPPPPPPNDTSILLGRLDLKLFAGAETDNTKAAQRLASDMGEFFMPFPGTRINQQTVPLNANGMPGVASYYEVKFTDTTKPDGQIWAGVVGEATPAGAPRGQKAPDRWFVVWLGTANSPIPKPEAVTLAQSIRPWTPPAPPPPPDSGTPPNPNAPAPDQNAPPAAPARGPALGVPVPVDPNSVPPAMQPSG